MSWGLGEWGLSPWGTGQSGPLLGESGPPEIYDNGPYLCEVEGGTILTILGAAFFPDFVPQVLSGPVGGPYVLEAEGYLFDPAYDLTPTKALPGMPALPTGVYSLRIKTPAGLSNVLDSVLHYKPFADEEMAQKGRASWSEKWIVGRRFGG